ncbi:MAG TPA: efflux RND transporter periplasmic adaptor subunit, partial [Candidatus Kapabacteria bacterium]|nr:efflux RND transporter periplasmic adaptor subunit [Candidatus Kapabacteria bacterium]
KNLKDCVLKAPISAMVGKKNVEPGSNSLLAGSAFTLYKIDEVLIKVPVQENEISKIKKGEVAKILVPALDNQEFSGTIQEIGVVSNPISHTYDIKIKIQNQNNLLKPGMVCNVYLKSNSNNGTISVPSNAVVSQNKKNYVYLINSNNSVTKQEVSVAAYQGNNIIIRSGLEAGDKIVVTGQQKLYDGASIVVNQ